MGYRDMDLDDQVKAAIRRDQKLRGIRIEVNVGNGIVRLRGSVTRRVRGRLLKLARGVEHVAAVVDELEAA